MWQLVLHSLEPFSWITTRCSSDCNLQVTKQQGAGGGKKYLLIRGCCFLGENNRSEPQKLWVTQQDAVRMWDPISAWWMHSALPNLRCNELSGHKGISSAASLLLLKKAQSSGLGNELPSTHGNKHKNLWLVSSAAQPAAHASHLTFCHFTSL